MPRSKSELSRFAFVGAAGSVVLLLITAPRYGFHRDELYFVVAGRNLDWGFVDQPPLTPLVARVSELIAGQSPFALRILPAFAVGAISLMAALIAKRVGGGRTAQTYAAVTTGFAGVFLGVGHLLSTAVFDFTFWTAALLIVIHLLDGASPRLWVALGAVVGVGLQNKHTIAFLAMGLLAGILLNRQRKLLADIWPWISVGLAGLIALPNFLWQWSNDFPQLEMARALQSRSDGPLAFALFQPLLLSVVLAVPAAIGWWRLARSDRLESWRPVAIAYLVLFLTFLATGGKAYYIAPMYSALLAAGALWFEELRLAARRWMTGFTIFGLLVGFLIALPIMPISSASTFDATGELGETVGWPELIEQVSVVYESIPPEIRSDTLIFTSSYGEAGAIDVLGPGAGLPSASSGHNNYFLWGPPQRHGPIIGVGHVEGPLEMVCPRFRRVGTISNPYGVENEEVGPPLVPVPLSGEPACRRVGVCEALQLRGLTTPAARTYIRSVERPIGIDSTYGLVSSEKRNGNFHRHRSKGSVAPAGLLGAFDSSHRRGGRSAVEPDSLPLRFQAEPGASRPGA